MMQIEVTLFGAFRNLSEAPRIEVAVPAGGTVRDLRHAMKEKLARLHPAAREVQLLDDSAFGNENRILADDELLATGARLAVIPPVCGG